MARHRDAPGQVDPGNRKIPQALGHEVLDFAPAAGRLDELRFGDQGFNLFLVAGEAEKEVELIAPFQRPLVHRALGIKGAGRIVLELLAGDAIPALLAPLDHIAIGLNPAKKLVNNAAVAGIGGADEAVVADLPLLPKLAVLGTDQIAMGLGA